MNTNQLLLVSSLGLAVNLFGMFAMGGHHHHVGPFVSSCVIFSINSACRADTLIRTLMVIPIPPRTVMIMAIAIRLLLILLTHILLSSPSLTRILMDTLIHPHTLIHIRILLPRMFPRIPNHTLILLKAAIRTHLHLLIIEITLILTPTLMRWMAIHTLIHTLTRRMIIPPHIPTPLLKGEVTVQPSVSRVVHRSASTRPLKRMIRLFHRCPMTLMMS